METILKTLMNLGIKIGFGIKSYNVNMLICPVKSFLSVHTQRLFTPVWVFRFFLRFYTKMYIIKTKINIIVTIGILVYYTAYKIETLPSKNAIKEKEPEWEKMNGAIS